MNDVSDTSEVTDVSDANEATDVGDVSEILGRVRRAFGRRAPQVLAPLLGHPLGAALDFDLDGLRMPSGGWEDLAWGPARLLDLPVLALHDLGHPAGDALEALEARLLDAAMLTAVALFLAEATVGAEAGHDPPSALLLGPLVSAATARLLTGAPDPWRTGARFAAAWTTHADALDLAGQRQRAWTDPGAALTPGVLAALGRRHAPLGAIFAHALESAGRPELVPALAPALETVAGLHQLLCDLDNLHRDLARAWWSLPVARLAAALGPLPPEDAPPPTATVLLAIVITRGVPVLAREALAEAEAVATTLAGVGLGRVASAVRGLEGRLHELLGLYDAGGTAATPVGAEPVAFRVDTRPRREQALEALRAALDDDPEARDAWRVRRVGSEQPEVDRLSGPATIVENRVTTGELRTADVDALALALQDAMDPRGASAGRVEVDALATLARLAPHASDPAAARRALRAPLDLALAARASAGALPAWVRVAGSSARAGGGGPCAGAQARLALGLLAWPDDPRAPAEELADDALARVASMGSLAFTTHDPLHGALVVLELADARGEASAAAEPARAWALAFARRWRGRALASPLAAAWLWLLTEHPRARDLREPRWRDLLLRGQRAAGTWDACRHLRESTAGHAHPGSRLVTTSFVYRALVSPESDRLPDR